MVRYDTPTDGISRKKFDRAMDSHIRRYTVLANELSDLRKEFKRLEAIVRIHGEYAKEKRG